MADSKYGEIRNEWDDIDNYYDICAWFTVDDNEEGVIIARVYPETQDIEYRDPDARTDGYAQEIIQACLSGECEEW